MMGVVVASAQLILTWICKSLAECVMTCGLAQVKAPELFDSSTLRMAILQKQKEALEQENLREREELLLQSCWEHLGTMVTLMLECSSMFELFRSAQFLFSTLLFPLQ